MNRGWFKPGHTVNVGRPCSEEKKKKISIAHKGKEHPGKFKAGHKINLGRKQTEETKRKHSLSMKGRKLTPEHYEKMKPRFFKNGKENIMHERMGSKHHNWKGGTTKHKQRLGLYEWKNKTKTVYERDNWECQNCGKHGGKLQCHHIIPWRISKCDDMENLITLCIPCHTEIENVMGLW